MKNSELQIKINSLNYEKENLEKNIKSLRKILNYSNAKNAKTFLLLMILNNTRKYVIKISTMKMWTIII